MDLNVLMAEVKTPTVRRRSGGDWLAVTSKDARLRIGVTADSEIEVREKFSSAAKRWIEILATEAAN